MPVSDHDENAPVTTTALATAAVRTFA